MSEIAMDMILEKIYSFDTWFRNDSDQAEL